MALVAETAASAVISQLVDKVLEYANMSWWPSARSVKAEAEKLQDKLPQIRLVLAAVQGDKIKQRNPHFDARLWQFRDAIEAADDVLDEIKYYELEEKIKERDNKVSGPLSGYKRKLVDFVKNSFVTDGVLNKLREAVKGLEAIASDVEPFLQLANSLDQQLVVNNFRETGSFLTENTVIGREKEKEEIVEWLMAQPNDHEQGLISVFSIFGMGGMGKTTLTQLVCKEQRVIENFKPIVWICVSDNSEIVHAKTIIKKIIEDVSGERCDLDNLNTLQNKLKEKIKSKKFLLVLDDVWRDDTLLEWEKIIAPLKFGERGSKILLTTRMKSVAEMVARVMEGENKLTNLAGLEEKDFMDLFCRHAFAGTDPNNHQYLHETGKQIAKKLWACPLAAKVIGGVLNMSLKIGFWDKILKEDILNIELSNGNIMNILKLSYYHLPTHLQLCFRYCSIFPQDHIFEKEKLVKMWMGSGLIPQYENEKRRPEDVGEEYLDQLTRKSFFNKDKYGALVIHDLLHDLAQCVSKGECLRITNSVSINIPRTTRHLSIEMKNNSMVRQIRNLNKLHTLVITCINHDLDLEQELNEIVSVVKSIRLLTINLEMGQKIPTTIGDLIHLRYISVGCKYWSRGRISGVILSPKSLYKLYHLQVINVMEFSSCNIDKSEMEGICNLINLRYCIFWGFAVWQISGLGKLSSLQELHYFYACDKSGSIILGKLKHLIGLQKLRVYGLSDVRRPDVVAEAEINKKEYLKSLKLNWSDDRSKVRDREEDVADNLKPPAKLNKLSISNYAGIRSPCWMNDSSCCNLTDVKLSSCYKWEHLPPLGQLNSLKSLKLSKMYAVKQVGYSLYGNSNGCVFPSLRQLQFEDMPEWEEWIGVGDKTFPCLENLVIQKCPKLKRFPSGSCFFPVLRQLGLNEMLELTEWIGPENELLFPFLVELIIRKCPQLKRFPTLPASLRRLAITDTALDALPLFHQTPRNNTIGLSLSELVISYCPNIVTLVFRSLHDLTSLTSLDLYHCASLRSLPPTAVFARIRSLKITSCKELASLNGIEVLTELKTLYISGCEKLTELSLQQPPLLSHNNTVDLAGHHLNIHWLMIDRTSLLLMEPLRSCRFIKYLEIDGDSQFISLPEQWLLQNRLSLEMLLVYEAASLQSLPSCMENMCTLEFVHIWGCKMLKSLPNLPLSLKHLSILECHSELADSCQETSSSIYWSRISHIPYVRISSTE